MRRSRFALLLVLGMLAAVLPVGAAAPALAVADGVIINEVDSDTPSYDELEFIELYDGGVGGTALDGLSVVLYNGSDDESYLPAFDLDGYSTDSAGYFVIGSVAGADIHVEPGSQGWLQNGRDAVALVQGNAVDYLNDSPLPVAGIVDAIVYDTNDTDDPVLIAALLNPGQPQVNEGGNGDKDHHSNQRCQNGEGGARNTASYDQRTPTPGAENDCPVPPPAFGACYDGLETPINVIQGDGYASPDVGVGRVIEAVVVGDFQGSGNLNGFFVQEEDFDADSDPATSEGLFVYDSYLGVDVAVGDVVRVRGTVGEYSGGTQLGGVDMVDVCASGASVTTEKLTLPRAPGADYESVEGMSVHFDQNFVATENYNLGRYGEVALSLNHLLENPTNVVPPGVPANNKSDKNDRSRILLDDGRSGSNLEPPSYIGEGGTLRVGDTTRYLRGVMAESNGSYRIHPTVDVTFNRVNVRPGTAPDVGGEVTVAAFNVLNYFTTLKSRGAWNSWELGRQRAKLVSAITAMDANVVGIMEVENADDNGPLLDLVAGLNVAVGLGTYAAIETGMIGTDEIAVGFIYQPAMVTPVGDFAILDSTVHADFKDSKNRPALAQTFEDGDGGRFTVVVNHLKSKGSSCASIEDPDVGDEQGNCNLTRTAAAEALATWLESDPTGSGDGDFLIIGDLNSYAKEDPIEALTDAGYTDLVGHYEGPDAYSYVFRGEAGYLDHALANKSMRKQVTDTLVWHINAAEPTALDYKGWNQDELYTTGPWRSSDHDPVIVGLDLRS